MRHPRRRALTEASLRGELGDRLPLQCLVASSDCEVTTAVLAVSLNKFPRLVRRGP